MTRAELLDWILICSGFCIVSWFGAVLAWKDADYLAATLFGAASAVYLAAACRAASRFDLVSRGRQ